VLLLFCCLRVLLAKWLVLLKECPLQGAAVRVLVPLQGAAALWCPRIFCYLGSLLAGFFKESALL
jgi:hypothetical protein